MMCKNKKNKAIWKQTAGFLLICMPITWLLMHISYKMQSENGARAYVLMTIACCIPAVSAVIVTLLNREKLSQLGFFPKFRNNGKIYFIGIITAVLLGCVADPLLMLFFPDVVKRNPDTTVLLYIFTILLSIVMGCLQCFMLLGEELGWMGYLYPRLEQLWGILPAICVTGIVRSVWHMVMLMKGEHVLVDFFVLCLNNIFGGCLFVLLTKKTASVVPAAVIHGLSNTIPGAIGGYYIINPVLYEEHYIGMQLVSLIPQILVGIIAFIVLRKKSDKITPHLTI